MIGNVIEQAIWDIAHFASSPSRAMDAYLWLTGPDFGLWCEAAGMPDADPLYLLINNGIKKFAERKYRYAYRLRLKQRVSGIDPEPG